MFFIILNAMELFQILHKNIPQRKNIFAHIQRKWYDVSKFLLRTMKWLRKGERDVYVLNAFFIELYDMLYSPIIFDEIMVARKIIRILEELALPIKYIGQKRWCASFKKIMKVKL